MYEKKLKRATKMYDQINEAWTYLNMREMELAEAEQQIRDRERVTGVNRGRGSSFSSVLRPTVVRAGSRTFKGEREYVTSIHRQQKVFSVTCSVLPSYSAYGNAEVSTSEEEAEDYIRNSPYRCSQASSSSGFPSSQSACFSRQSSSRSSTGGLKKRESRTHYSNTLTN